MVFLIFIKTSKRERGKKMGRTFSDSKDRASVILALHTTLAPYFLPRHLPASGQRDLAYVSFGPCHPLPCLELCILVNVSLSFVVPGHPLMA